MKKKIELFFLRAVLQTFLKLYPTWSKGEQADADSVILSMQKRLVELTTEA